MTSRGALERGRETVPLGGAARPFTDLSPLSSATSLARAPAPSVGVSRAAPPRGFKFIRGQPSAVRFGGSVPHNKGRTYAQKLGLRYEQKVHDVLSAIYGDHFRASPSILYEDRTGLRRAIPDGLLDFQDRVVIVEVKYSHCELAWWQLNKLYGELLLHLTTKSIQVCEIVHTFDPDVKWPTRPTLVTSLHKIPRYSTGVLQWKI
jgi:hypothetical protein